MSQSSALMACKRSSPLKSLGSAALVTKSFKSRCVSLDCVLLFAKSDLNIEPRRSRKRIEEALSAGPFRALYKNCRELGHSFKLWERCERIDIRGLRKGMCKPWPYPGPCCQPDLLYAYTTSDEHHFLDICRVDTGRWPHETTTCSYDQLRSQDLRRCLP